MEKEESKTNLYRDYLKDLSTLLRDTAENAMKEWEKEQSGFNSGQLMAYHQVLSLMVEQAEAFQIRLKDVGLETIDPDKYLAVKQ